MQSLLVGFDGIGLGGFGHGGLGLGGLGLVGPGLGGFGFGLDDLGLDGAITSILCFFLDRLLATLFRNRGADIMQWRPPWRQNQK